MKKLVVVGGGVAGFEIASKLGKKLAKKDYNVCLIDKDSVHLWKPSLHTIAAGTSNLCFQQVPFLSHAREHHFIFCPGEISGIDKEKKQVWLKPLEMDGNLLMPKRSVDYDILVLAVGSSANDFGTQGVKEFCHFIDSKSEAEAFNKKLRALLLSCAVHENEKLIVSIVGGGATGVELAAEISQLVEIAKNYQFDVSKSITVNLIESSPEILSQFPQNISSLVEKELEGLGIHIYKGTSVTEATKEGFKLADGRMIPSSIMVWSAGVKGAVSNTDFGNMHLTGRDTFEVNSFLQSLDDPSIFAVGDCSTIVDAPLAPTAQVAHQQAHYLVKSIPRWINGKKVKPFRYWHLGGIVSIGKYNAYGSLGKFKLYPGWFLQGKLAQYTYGFIYFSHQVRIHGFFKGVLFWITGRLNKYTQPPVRMD